MTTTGILHRLDVVRSFELNIFDIISFVFDSFKYKFKVPQKEYSISCANNNQCKASMGLTCSTTNNVCVCPLQINANRCDCTATQYYDPTIGCRKTPLKQNDSVIFALFISLIKKAE